jgi:hypothetical protein
VITWNEKNLVKLRDTVLELGYDWDLVADALDSSSQAVKKAYYRHINNKELPTEIDDIAALQELTLKSEIRSQKEKDINRLKNAAFRDSSRILNAIEEHNKELISLLQNMNISKFIDIPQLKKKNAGEDSDEEEKTFTRKQKNSDIIIKMKGPRKKL